VIASLATGPRPVFLLRGAVVAEQFDDRGVLDDDVLTGKVPVAIERNLMPSVVRARGRVTETRGPPRVTETPRHHSAPQSRSGDIAERQCDLVRQIRQNPASVVSATRTVGTVFIAVPSLAGVLWSVTRDLPCGTTQVGERHLELHGYRDNLMGGGR
jgi:hypothetical protein